MREIIQSKFAACLRRVMRSRVACCFVRQQDGAAAVEFALVAAPFLALMFAILETAMVFFASQTLEFAAADSARLIMTGEAQSSNFTAGTFKQKVCERVGGLFDCEGGLIVDVKNYGQFSTVINAPPVTDNKLDSGKAGYSPGGPNCIIVVSLYYSWPVYVSIYSTLANLDSSHRLLTATSVFRNEPYGGGNACP